MKNAVFWDVTLCSSGNNKRFGGTIASIIRAAQIGDLGTALAVTNNRSRLLLTNATQINITEDGSS
jgi:hypothetical protein